MREANEIELAKLDKLISELQWQIFNDGGSPAAITSMLVKRLTDAQNRSATVHREEQREKGKKDQTELHEQSIAIAKAEREHELTQSEQREYASFLECEFFTKAMFPRLDHFYSQTWDRLSDGGKAEMSKRVWEGVNQGQYRFNELPESVKEKEAERMHHYLTSENTRGTFEQTIPHSDRQEFCTAYEVGDKQRSYSVLERPSFAKAVHHAEVFELVSKDVTTAAPEQMEAVKATLAKAAISSEPKRVASANLADLAIDETLLSELRDAQGTPAKAATDFKQAPIELRR
jgi:hypothetical protein